MTGGRKVQESDFLESGQNIEIETRLQIEKEDLRLFHELAVVSAYRRYEVWERDFQKKLPSFQKGTLSFTCMVNREGRMRFSDGVRKHNPISRRCSPDCSTLTQTESSMCSRATCFSLEKAF